MNTKATLPNPALLIDAAGPLVQTGLWVDGQWVVWKPSRDEAGRSIFAGVAAILAERKITIDDLGSVLFCEGPGSMLGNRIAAMAVRGWQALRDEPIPVFLYNSHALLAAILKRSGHKAPFHIISDARRNRWNVLTISSDGTAQPLRRLEREQLIELTGPFLRMEENIRNEPPVSAEMIPYDLSEHAALFSDSQWLRQTDEPDVLLQEAPEYKKWNEERHRSA